MLSRRQWFYIISIISLAVLVTSSYIIFTEDLDEIENVLSVYFLSLIMFTSLLTLLSAGSLASYISTPKVIRLPVTFNHLFFGYPIFSVYIVMSLLIFIVFGAFIIYQVIPEEFHIYVTIILNIITNILIASFVYFIIRMALMSLGKITRTGSVFVFLKSAYRKYKARKKQVNKNMVLNSQIQSILRSGKLSSMVAQSLKKEWKQDLKRKKQMLWLTYFMVAWSIGFGTYNIHSAFMTTDLASFTMLFICGIAMYLLIFLHHKNYKSERDGIARLQAEIDML